jgi:pyrroline-5-carboxylate reductase
MGQTLLRGLLSGKLIAHDRVWAGDKNTVTCETASAALGIIVESDFHPRVSGAALILLCVKPNDAPALLAALRDAGLRRETLLIPILAGVGTDRLESMLGTENPVVRAMPNTPAVVGEGMTATWGRYATKTDLERAQAIFEAVGLCLPVDEVHFNAVTALSASGPAYEFLIMEALADAGVRVGLPRQLALTLVAQTTLGSARMVLSTGRTADAGGRAYPLGAGARRRGGHQNLRSSRRRSH